MTELLTVLVSLGLLLGQWWLSSAPARAAKRRRRENARIHNDIARHDVKAVRERLRRLRAEGS